MGEMRNAHKILDGKQKGRDHLGGLDAGEKIILKWILKELFGSGQGPVAGSSEHGNEPLGSIKGREFLD
jgi:hypothetical protein